MAYKVLGQVTVAANTDTTLYTVPGAVAAVVSTITVCNQNATPVTYRIAVRPAGAGIAGQHYVAYDVALAGNAVDAFTLGITLATTDVVTVRANSTLVSFNAYGNES